MKKNNQKKFSTKLLASVLVPLAIVVPASAYLLHNDGGTTASQALDNTAVAVAPTTYHVNKNDFANQQLNPKALKQALRAYHWAVATGKVHNKKVLTIVDFTLPSDKKRLFVVNPNTGQVLMSLHTAQGKNSGLKYATHFSNKLGSDASSLGAYVTANVYDGKHGESERLIGLEKGINNNAMKRAVVIHPANYVTPGFIKAQDRAGRSWGCFAVNPQKSKQLINLVKGGSVLFAYAPAENHDPNFS